MRVYVAGAVTGVPDAPRQGSADAQRVLSDWARSPWDGRPQSSDRGCRSVTTLPTPTVTDWGARWSIEAWDAMAARLRRERRRAHGRSLDVEAPRLDVERTRVDWREYAGAVESHARLVGRPAPLPTEPAPRGGRPPQRGGVR